MIPVKPILGAKAMRQDKELRSALLPEVGWLAPDGKYYPGERGGNWLHLEVEQAIMRKFYPDVEFDIMGHIGKDMLESTATYLWQRGYIRVDVKGLYPDETMFGDHPNTQEQADTLFKLYGLRGWPTRDVKEAIKRWVEGWYQLNPDFDR